MTKLRDDGLLETDEPVVKAAFLGQIVQRPTLPPITWDNPLGIDLKAPYRLDHVDLNDAHPILISAAVVAEVFYASELAMYVVTRATDQGESLTPTYKVVQWLRTHNAEGDQPK